LVLYGRLTSLGVIGDLVPEVRVKGSLNCKH
jgi:hypothetical protein